MTDAYLDWYFGLGLICASCRAPVDEDDTVWVNPETGEASTGDEGKPFHIGCAPPQHAEPALTEEDLKQIYQEIQEK